MLKNTLSAALVLAIVGTGALVAPPVAASAAPVLTAVPVTTSAVSDLDDNVIDHGDDMLELLDTPVARRNLAKAELSFDEAGTVGNPEVHPLYFAVTSTTTSTTDDDLPNLDETSLRALTDRLNSYWFAESGGTIRFAWGGIETRSISATDCDPNGVNTAISQSAFGGIFANNSWAGTSRHLITLAKEKASCGGGQAFGTVSGPAYSGGLVFSSQGTDLGVGTPTLQHELGHNLGFRHASASICRSTTNFDSTIDQFGPGATGAGLNNTAMQCPTEDYGDVLDIMGYTVTGSSPHLSTPLKITNNFMTDYSTATPTNAGTFTIAPIDNAVTGGAIRSLKISDPITGENYYVEYRTKVGTDTNSLSWSQSPTTKAAVDGYQLAPYEGTAATANGTVRIQRQYFRDGYWGTTTLAVAPTSAAPSNLQVRRPFLIPGQTFVNDKGVFTVTVNSVSASTGANVTVAFKQVPTTTTLTLNRTARQSLNVAPSVTATGKVSAILGNYPTGTMTITADGATVGSGSVNSSGEYAIALPTSLSVGTHAIKAKFTPSSSVYGASESADASVTVLATTTTTAVALNNGGSQAYDNGARVTATATVTSASGITPAGSVEFSDGGTPLTTVAVNASGVASYQFPATTPVGSHAITARFTPSTSDYSVSTSQASTLTVTATPSSVAFTLDNSASQTYGSATVVTAQASVAALSGGGYPAGKIEFVDGSTVLASVPVSGTGVASYSFSSTLPVGSHSITAKFVPTSSSIASSTSTAKALTVAPAPTSTTVTLDNNGKQTFYSETPVTATAVVGQVAGDYPAGSFEFRNGSTVLRTVTASATGTASYTFSRLLGTGTYPITAVFTPASTTYLTSTSAAVTLIALPAPSRMVVTFNGGGKQVYLGTRELVLASLDTLGDDRYPQGTVEFREGSTVLGSDTVDSNGHVFLVAPSTLAVGDHAITAYFTPSSTDYAATTSAAATLTVTAAQTTSTIALDKSATQVFASSSPVTATATIGAVNGVTPAGSFQFLSGTTVLDTAATNASGVATYTFSSSTAVGGYSITARFVPTSGNFAGSTSTAKTLTVTPATTGVALALDRDQAQVYGSTDRVTATSSVAPVAGVYPTGTIEFRDGTDVLVTVSSGSSGTASYTFASTTTAGTHSITAKFIPSSSSYDGATSAAKVLTVSKTPTTASFTLDRSGTQVFGSSTPVTAQASIAELPTGGYAAGSVEFLDGSTVRGTVPVSASGIATYTFSSTLATGDHTITVRFVPSSSNIAGATSLTRTLTVVPASTTATLSLDRASEQTFASSSRVTATASVIDGNGQIQAGTVTFSDEGTVLDTVTLNAAGTATFVFPSNTSAGSHAIVASFAPALGSYLGSSSTPSTLTVRAAQSTIELSLDKTTQVYLGSSTVTGTATIAAVSGTFPAGQVEFREGSSVLATVTVNASGVATYALASTLAYGSHDIAVRFLPTSSNYIGSASTTSTVTVTSSPTSTSLALSSTSQSFATANPATATATVATVNGVLPTGTIQFFDGDTLLDTIATNPTTGVALLTLARTYSAGGHSLTARFVPATGSFTTSVATAKSFTVNAATTATTISLDRATQVFKSPTTAATTATVAAVAGVFPAGNFVFLDGTTTLATIPAGETGSATFAGSSALSLGQHTITARFEPTSANYSASTSAGKTLAVVASATTTTITLSNSGTQALLGTPATVTASVSELAGGGYGPGSISFRKDGTEIANVPVSATGTASFTFPNTYSVGSYAITANFAPSSAESSASTATAKTLVVTAAPTETAVTFDNSGSQVYSLNPRVTATATVTATGRTGYTSGTVTFYDGVTVLASNVSVGGTSSTATYTFLSTTAVGDHQISAVFTPSNSQYLGSTSTNATMTVTPASTSTSILVTSMQQAYLTAPSATVTAQLALVGNGYPVGKVEFRDGSTVVGTADVSSSTGRAAFTFAADTTVGSHSITATFVPAGNTLTASTSAAATLTVRTAPTTTSLTLTAGSYAYGSAVTSTATAQISQVGGFYPAGIIQFLDGTTLIASPAVTANGTATWIASADFPAANHSITARFVPLSTSIAESTSPARALNISKGAAAITLTLDKTTQQHGTATPAVATANVSLANGAFPAGNVVFRDGTTAFASVTVSASGIATTALPASLVVGSRSITAVFQPVDASLNPSTSAVQTVAVSKFISTTTLELDNNATQVYNSGTRVTATAQVSAFGAGGYPAGNIQFRTGVNTVLATVTVTAGGTASYTYEPTLAAGSYTVSALFVSSFPSVDGSLSSDRTLTVTKAPTTTALALDNGATQVYGASARVTATANVGAVNGSYPAGNIDFRDNGASIGSVAVDSNGRAVLALDATTTAGAHTLTAVFQPAISSYVSSTSADRVLTVTEAPSTTALSLDHGTQDYLGSTSITATARAVLAGGAAVDGAIEFRDGTTVLSTVTTGSDGYASYELAPDLAVGSHSITARIVPANASISGSTSAASSLQVFAAATSTSLDLDKSGIQELGGGDRVTATATVARVRGVVPAGSIEFRDGAILLATVPLDGNGSATHTFAEATTVGEHSIIARFVPSAGSFVTSVSNAATLLITKGHTTTSISLSRDGVQSFGATATVVATAQVARVAGVFPQGTFTFFDGSAVLATIAATANGSATYTAPSSLEVGVHAISARFVPTLASTYMESTSDSAALTVASSASRVVIALDPDSQVYGDGDNTATAIATVDDLADGTQPGVVTFFEGATTLGTARVDENGNAYYRFTANLAVGPHVITAKFAPDSTAVTGSTTAVSRTLTVRPVGTQTVITYLDQSAQQSYYDLTRSTAYVVVNRDDSETPTGKVTFYSDGTAIGSVDYSGGQVTYTLPGSIVAGQHAITARFIPSSATVAPSESGPETLTVHPTYASTDVYLSEYYQEYGSASTSIANVRVMTITDGYSPTGKVEVFDGDTLLGTATLSRDASDSQGFTSIAKFALPSDLSVGSHSISGRYLSNDSSVIADGRASARYSLTVSPAAPVTSLEVGLTLDRQAAQIFGSVATVTATATVTTQSGSVPKGSVKFIDGSRELATVPVSASGVATYVFPNTTAGGQHAIIARFVPTSPDLQSVESATATLQVSAATPVVTMSLDRSTTAYGSSSPVTAQVSVAMVGGVTPKGYFIVFVDSRADGSPVPTSTGTGTVSLPTNLAVGAHSVTVLYSSNISEYSYAHSAQSTLSVTGAATTTILSLNRSGTQAFKNPLTVTATATIASVNGEQPSGNVRFLSDGAVIATVRLTDSGSASYTFESTLSAGAHSITAEFLADSWTNFVGSTSAAKQLTVTMPTRTTTSISLSDGTQIYGTDSPVRVSATVTAGATHPAGSVEFFVDGVSAGTRTAGGTDPTLTLDSALSAGTHEITARFTADTTEFGFSVSDPAVLTVTKLKVAVTLTASKTSQLYGSTSRATLTATINAAAAAVAPGSIVFRYGTTATTVAISSNGTAALTLPALTKAGTQLVTATFIPKNAENVTGSTSSIAKVTVTKAKSTATLALKASSVKVKKTSTATVTIKVTGVAGPAGTITLYNGTKKLKAYSLAASKKGKIAITVPAFAKKGTVKLKVVYSGDSNIAASTSAAKSLKVN